MPKKVAVSYKGKHFVIQDENTVDDFDIIDEYVNVEKILGDEKLLRSHVADCIYYGIPAYVGRDEELKKKVEALEAQLMKGN